MTKAELNVFLNNGWMKQHLEEIKKKAGQRYIPELHVELPIAEIFEGISRTPRFYGEIRKHYGNLIRESKYLSKYEIENIHEINVKFGKEFINISELLRNIWEYNTKPIPWNEITNLASNAQDLVRNLIEVLNKYKESIIEKKENADFSPRRKVDDDIHHLLKIQEELYYFIDLASCIKGKLSNHPFLLLTGEAGIGKTHLLCDIVENRVYNNLLAVLIFGEYFKEGVDVWEVIIRQSNLPEKINSKEEFLSLLNEAGIFSKCRSLLIIDALNEIMSPNFWKKNLKQILEQIKDYPNIALIISIRNGFEEEVLTDELRNEFIEEIHPGFSLIEWEAVTKFFIKFSIPLPEVPLLTPEFQNPLFLLLFCKAFQKRKNQGKQIFRGHKGFTYIFENYVDSVAETMEDEFGIPHCSNENIWDTIIEKIAEEMVKDNIDRVSEGKLNQIIKNYHPDINIDEFVKSLDRNLLLTRIPKYSEDYGKIEYYDYKFPFQKFSDHLIVRYLLKRCKAENKQPAEFFTADASIVRLLKLNYGLVEALSIQLPEWFEGKELFECAPYLKDYNYIYDAFVESLIWRRPQAVSEETIKKVSLYIKEKALESVLKKNEPYDDCFIYPEFTYKLLDALLSVASVPEHPLNADFLHNHLLKLSQSERDAWWSTFLHFQYHEKNAAEMMIEWSCLEYDKSYISNESIFLLGTALVWFLTTPNRFIRDKSTKALVSIMQHRIHLIPQLLEKFKEVNDIYILERLFAISYGCVLRNQDDLENIEKVAKWVYNNVFRDKKPPTHILLRDYARGIIEVALRKGIRNKIDENQIRPPYQSDFPEDLPSDNDIKKCEFDSMNLTRLMYGDFGRYVFQSCLSQWDTKEIKIQQLSNLAIKIILDEIGYNVELHGKFDRNLIKQVYSREPNKPERIGKKYQWMAFHRILALVSDHFLLKKDSWSDEQKKFKGPWNMGIRDIDPTLLMRDDNHLKRSIFFKNWFSTTGKYDAWAKERVSCSWIKAKEDLPDPASIIQITDDKDQDWFVLEDFIRWEEDIPQEYEKYEIPIRELWYLIKSYIVRIEDLKTILSWIKGRNFWGKWMPESNVFHEIFLGEYPNSLAFEDLKGNYDIWTKGGDLPVEVVVTDDIYSGEFTHDCSFDESISIKLPCKWLVNKMQLKQSFNDGKWFNTNRELIALPMSIFEKGSLSALLFKKDSLCRFLEDNKYAIFWTLLGEKRLIGGNLTHQDYEGHLIVNGVYTIDGNHNLVGEFNAEFEK